MKIDDLISKMAQDLADAKEPIKRVLLDNCLFAMQRAVAIRVRTRAEARLMLDVYRQSLTSFPEDLAAAPHRYAVDWPVDARVDVARRLTKGDKDEKK